MPRMLAVSRAEERRGDLGCWLLVDWTFVLVVAVVVTTGSAARYSVSATRVSEDPVVSQSAFSYIYNAAVVYRPDGKEWGLVVRCQNRTSSSDPYQVGPSVLAFVRGELHGDVPKFRSFGDEAIVFAPAGRADDYGTEDPRIVYREEDGTFYMMYTAVETETKAGGLDIRLSLATADEPSQRRSWVRHGSLFPDPKSALQSTKSGALLFGDPPHGNGTHVLFFGDSSRVPGLQVATSSDLRHFGIEPGLFLPVRESSFDSHLVEAGPPPVRLADGNLLFLYNSARAGFPSAKPGYDLQYNIGFAILDGEDPRRVLERSANPILSPDLSWERNGLTPNVVFCEGLLPLGNDRFLAFYGAGDSVIGAAVVEVSRLEDMP